MRTALGISRAITAAFALVITSGAFAADDGVWTVKKSSGEVWMGSSNVQPASVKADEVLKPGDTVRTGRNGRVLLVRGEESILIAPNSVVGLPAEKKEGLSTTIKQQAGSILLEVEKKNVRHFEVETPYLAAVVKGTQFRVTVNAAGTTVDVARGQVEVSDFKSGQTAQIMAGQHATAFSHGNAGLKLGGSGTLQPIQPGQPRASSVDRVPVPKNGLMAPNNKPGSASTTQPRHAVGGPRHGVTRISSTLGEVRLNVHRATDGLARNSGAATATRSAANRDSSTVWGSDSSAMGGNPGQGNANGGGGNAGSAGAANAGGGGASPVAASVAAVVGSGAGGGNGNNGNHYGWGNGNGHAYGRGRR